MVASCFGRGGSGASRTIRLRLHCYWRTKRRPRSHGRPGNHSVLSLAEIDSLYPPPSPIQFPVRMKDNAPVRCAYTVLQQCFAPPNCCRLTFRPIHGAHSTLCTMAVLVTLFTYQLLRRNVICLTKQLHLRERQRRASGRSAWRLAPTRTLRKLPRPSKRLSPFLRSETFAAADLAYPAWIE